MKKPKRDRVVPEFSVEVKRPRAGFVPGYDSDVDIWQVYCRKESTGEFSRARVSDLRKAGFKPR